VSSVILMGTMEGEPSDMGKMGMKLTKDEKKMSSESIHLDDGDLGFFFLNFLASPA
jgi:hypothetical protein